MSDLDESIKTRFQNEKHRMLVNIVFTSNWLRNKRSEFLKPYDLSFQQFNILRILRGNGGWMTMNDVKSVMIDKAPHMTRMVTKLLDKGFVERKPCLKDRRVTFIQISKPGLALLEELDQKTKDEMRMLDGITLEEAKVVNSVLDRIRN